MDKIKKYIINVHCEAISACYDLLEMLETNATETPSKYINKNRQHRTIEIRRTTVNDLHPTIKPSPIDAQPSPS